MSGFSRGDDSMTAPKRERARVDKKAAPGAPRAVSVCSLNSFCSRLALATAPPAVGAKKYISEKFRMLPTCTP